jgi:hypothetical protein
MPKSAKNSSAAAAARARAAQHPSHAPGELKNKATNTGSKQSRVVAMLQSPEGTTVAAMMKATGWQQHSVRGFLAGVVRKKLKLKLNSAKVDGGRIYRIDSGHKVEAGGKQSKRRAA